HPLLKEALDLRNDLIYAEIETGLLPVDGVERVLEMPSEFPAVRRDITLKVPQRELAQRVLKSIEDEAAPNLAEVVILDDFRKSDEDFRRLTLRMTFQSSERTLQSSEVDEAVQRLLSGIREARGYDLA
ncbi:MAG: hypothetical protein DCC75_08405, partial [Proteobacteria bacterium]